MKKFISNNWYRLLIGTSFFLLSFSIFIYSISSVFANPKSENYISFSKIIKPNLDGSINVKLSDDQLKKISKFNEIQNVNIEQIRGLKAGIFTHVLRNKELKVIGERSVLAVKIPESSSTIKDEY